MARHLSLTARVGLALVLVPVVSFCYRAWWESTRIWTPVDAPVSVGSGPIRTASFRINEKGNYAIAIAVNESLRCFIGSSPCDSEASTLEASWVLSEASHVPAKGSGSSVYGYVRGTGDAGFVLGGFHADAGRYVLSVNLKNGDGFTFGHPRLVVYESGGQRERAAGNTGLFLLISVGVVSVGTAVLMRSAMVSRSERQRVLLDQYAFTRQGPQPQIRPVVVPFRTIPRIARVQHRKLLPANAWPFMRPHWFGLVATTAFALLIVPDFTIHDAAFHRAVPRGLLVHVKKSQQSPAYGSQPLLVRIEWDDPGRRVRVFVDSRIVPNEDLNAVLRQELRNRPPDWPVYVEAEAAENLEWGDVGQIIDQIRGLGAEVTLLRVPGHPLARPRRRNR